MDLSFARFRAQPSAPLPLDYPRLIAILVSVQGASRTAQVAARIAREDLPRARSGGLVALFDSGCDPIAAAAALGGRFNPAVRSGKSKPV